MNINRNNYEEFFLMYVDNELSAADRQAVDAFVLQNPDLGKELLMLQETVLNPSPIIFNDKDALLKADAVETEQLLLLMDNELDAAGIDAVNKMIATSPAVAAEWKSLQQAKLEAEAVVFENKALLYRRETGKVVGMRWWKMAAAAILIGFGVWGVSTFFTQNKNKAVNDTVKETPADKLKPNDPVITNDQNKDQQALSKHDDQQQNIVSPAINNPNSQKQAKEKQNKEAVDELTKLLQQPDVSRDLIRSPSNPAPVEKTNPVANNNKDRKEEPLTNNLPTPLQKINNTERNEKITVAVSPIDNPIKISPVSTLTQQDPGNDPKNNGAVVARYNPGEITTDPEEDNSGKRSKLKGLFKKVKKVFERTTNSGSSLKVAGFSIGIKS